MRERWWTAALRVALLGIGVVALSWPLAKFESTRQTLALAGIFSAGVLLLIEAAILHRRIREPGGEEDPNFYYWLEVSRPTANWFWRVGTSLLLASSFGFISLLFHPSLRPTEHSQITVRFTDEIEKALTTHPAPYAGPAATDGTLKLDPGLQAAMLEYFRKPAVSNGGMPWWVLILIIVAAAALVLWAIKREPEATPLAAAIAAITATASVIEELVKGRPVLPLGNVPWPAVLVSLGLVALGIYLIWYGSRYLLHLIKNNGAVSIKNGTLLGTAVSIFGFSAVLLAVLPPLLFHSEPTLPKPVACPQCASSASIMDAEKISALSLTSVNNLGDGRRPEDEAVDPTEIHQLTEDLHNKGARDDDILLLLGSADCIPTRPKKNGGRWDSNEELAGARADWVSKGLKDQPAAHGITIKPLPLPQHARCGKAPNLRAVYPFLFHAENSHSGDSRP